MKTRAGRLSCCFGLALVLGCGAVAPPSAEDIRGDLVGQSFAVTETPLGSELWKIEEGQLSSLEIVRRQTNAEVGTDVVVVAVKLESVQTTLDGSLRLYYRHYDDGWSLDQVERAEEFARTDAIDFVYITMRDMRNVGTAMFSWLTDQYGAAAAAGQTPIYEVRKETAITVEELEELLVPHYVQSVPREDGWGHPFEYHINLKDLLRVERVMMIRSPGSDGVFDGEAYEQGKTYSFDYSDDIVWADGFFIRYPETEL